MLTMRFLLPLMLVLVTCWASNPFDVPSHRIQENIGNYRLPEDVIPSNYNIELTPIFISETPGKENFTFDGTSKITLTFTKALDNITFHAKELTIHEDSILLYSDDSKNPKRPKKLITDEQKDFVTLTFDKEIPEGKVAELSLSYSGKLNDELRGFYRSSYQDKDGKTRWLATTHFEPIGARQAFPCWDEPRFKASFTISITVPQNDYQAISNMELSEKKETKTIFKETPAMSTYLVAFVVSDFTNITQDYVSVWAKPTVEEGDKKFAVDYGLKTLKELKDFTNIDYKDPGMTKMDEIAIPDFIAGAMENWGLVTYRESALLTRKDKTTTEEMQSIATVIAHEFSHQWFGNLVTCEWWDYIWLNEGFATFFQYYISNKIVPSDEEWRLMEQFVIKNVQASSFVVDASSTTRPLNPKVPVQTPTQIHSLFDDIAYKKGASILRMMQEFLSEDIFREGLRNYLRTNTYSSVDSDKFFDSVQESNKTAMEALLPKDVTLKDVMKNWVSEPGYPVITVSWNKTASDIVDITQERFFLVKPAKEDKTQWYIPINYVTEESPENIKPKDKKSGWLIPDNSLSFKENNTQWILFNKDQTGYYRVNYDEFNWNLLANYLNTSDYVSISAINRAQLIDDALNLARAGYLAYETALEITSYLKNETDYIPWYAAVRGFDYLDSVLQNSTKYGDYRKYVASKISKFGMEVKYDWDNGTHVDKLARVLVLNAACKYGEKECEKFTGDKLTEWLVEKKKNEDETYLSPDLRSGILCAGIRSTNADIWNKTLAKYKKTEDKEEKTDILAALGCTTDEEVIKIFLESTLEKDPHVDVFSAMNSICAGNAKSFDILVEFINDNIEYIRKADTEDNELFFNLLNNLANRVITVEQYAELSYLVYEQLNEELQQKIEGLAVAIHKISWVKNYQEKVEKWIGDNCEVCQNVQPPRDSASSITLTSFLLIISLLITRF